MKDKVAEILGLSYISPEDLEYEIVGQDIIKLFMDKIFIKICRNLSIEKSQTDGFLYILLRRYLQAPFRDFESYLRVLTGLNEDDIQLLLKQ